MTTTVSKTTKTIKKVLKENNFKESDFGIEFGESDICHWIDIYTPYMDMETLKKLNEKNIEIINIWPDKHTFGYTEGIKVECVKTTVAIRK